MAKDSAGYSGTPLVVKLGLKPGFRTWVSGAPPNYRALLAPLPDSVRIASRRGHALDFVHLFVKSRAELVAAIHAAQPAIHPDGVIWVSWPKKASKIETDIDENVIRDVVLPLGLVDIKVCAIDAVWSALKLVIRKELRPKPPRGKSAKS